MSRSQVFLSGEPWAFYVLAGIIVVVNLVNVVYIVPGILAVLQILAMFFAHKAVLKPGKRTYVYFLMLVFLQILVLVGSFISFFAMFDQARGDRPKNHLLGEECTFFCGFAGIALSWTSLSCIFEKRVKESEEMQRKRERGEEMKKERQRKDVERRKEMDNPVEVNGQKTNIGEPVDNNEDSKSSK